MCEGGAIIDHDNQYLLWFGGEDILSDISERRAFLTLMQCQWPGWQIQWVHRGIVDLGAHLGFPAEKFLHELSPITQEDSYLERNAFCVDPEENNTLLSVRAQGCVSVTCMNGL